MRSEISDTDFELLVRRTLTDVAATTPGDGPVDPSAGRQSKMGSSWLQVAATLLVVAGIGGLILAQRQTETPPAAQYASRIDPTAHLFVLPEDTRGLELSNGGVYTVRPDETEGPIEDWVGFLMGIELSDGVFSELVQVTTAEAIPAGFDVDGATEIDTPTGPAIVNESLGYQLAQQRGDAWLLLSAGGGTQRLVDALAQITIGSAGTPVLEEGPMSIIEQFQQSSATVGYTTYYEAAETASGTRFVVETATSSSVIAFGAAMFETAQPTSVNGTPAWLLTRDGDPPEGVNAAVVWRATPNRIVAISAHTKIAVVEAMAERLQEVSAEKWSAALPDSVIED